MRASRRLGALAVLAIGAVALGAGCGGDDDDGALSAEEFRSQADAVCASFDQRTEDIENPTSADEVQPFLEQNLDLQREQLEELQAITPPDDLADDWNEALGLLDDQIDDVQDVLDDIEGGADPVEAINEASETLNDNTERLQELAGDLGLEECGNGETASSDDGDTDADTTGDDTLDDTTTEATTTEADTTGDDTSTPTETGSIATYIDDVTDAAQALVAFGTLLQNVDSPAELETQSAEARAELDKFDAAIQAMSGYTLDNARLEEQRAGLVATGGDVSSSLNEFIDAAEAGDTERVQELVPEVTQALSEFQSAATAGSTP
jgi:hypothetical protein